VRRLLLAAAAVGVILGGTASLATDPDGDQPPPCTPGTIREDIWRPGTWLLCRPDQRWHREQNPTRPLPDPIPA
jgi:hypothetical protein